MTDGKAAERFVLDEKDTAILVELQRDAKATTGKIAKRTGIPVTTVHNRIKRFEREGVIQKYEPRLDFARLGLGIHALVFLTAASAYKGAPVDQQALARTAMRLEGVQRACILTGTFDLVLEVRVRDVGALNGILLQELRRILGVEKTQTMLVLEEHRR